MYLFFLFFLLKILQFNIKLSIACSPTRLLLMGVYIYLNLYAFKLGLASWSQTSEESISVAGSLEGDSSTLLEVENITWLGGNLVPGLVGDPVLTLNLQDDLHLIVVVVVDQWLTLLLLVETTGDLLFLRGVGGESVTQEGVVAWRWDLRRLDFLSLSGWLVQHRHFWRVLGGFV
ncbi:hypothetical protein PUMCH_004230 [Australozyma saopauloensis]|uniref:Uncharacterized protein n=1 Tax=Australozyma saopauloensis TaxID=291208 RepID=A0AAX4HEP0_9ASCO|nr:hypothetical protein PUMCH_004230 [[Candida] saopauloensis]